LYERQRFPLREEEELHTYGKNGNHQGCQLDT